MDISQVIAPDSDEMVAADLIGSPPKVFTITGVSEATRDGKRVADVRLEGFPRPWRPGKGMSRVMADNWGNETQAWIGRRVELYGDPDVYFGKEKTGGVRISRLSHIDRAKTTRVNPRGGKNGTWAVEPLPDAPTEPTLTDLAEQVAAAVVAAATEADVREWGNRANARGLLDVKVAGRPVRDIVTSKLADLAQEVTPDGV